jgi:two-component system cell cycle sensor histidine kinase/response regulator CckA
MSKGRIVVVEDETIVARDIQATLRSFGYEVPEIVTSGEEAIQAAFRLNPDLMVMDIMIKGAMDGVDAAEIIRSQFNIPVVYLTAYSDDETLRRAKLTESYGFIAKPFDERELFVAVEFALYKHQMNFKMQETKSWLESTLRSVPMAIIAMDKDDKISVVNQKAEFLLGYKEHEIKGKPLSELLKLSGMGDNPDLEQTTTYQTRKGSPITLTYRQGPVRNEKGILTGKVVVLQ